MSKSNDAVALTIMRTVDASKVEIHVPLQMSVNDLKNVISSSSLGPIAPHHQRLFHLGRELKSGGRSLVNIGIGKFNNYTLHLVSTQPETCDLLSSSEEEEDEDKVVISTTQPITCDLLSSSSEEEDDDDAVVVSTQRITCDLLSSSSEEEDDDDEVEVVQIRAKRKQAEVIDLLDDSDDEVEPKRQQVS